MRTVGRDRPVRPKEGEGVRVGSRRRCRGTPGIALDSPALPGIVLTAGKPWLGWPVDRHKEAFHQRLTTHPCRPKSKARREDRALACWTQAEWNPQCPCGAKARQVGPGDSFACGRDNPKSKGHAMSNRKGRAAKGAEHGSTPGVRARAQSLDAHCLNQRSSFRVASSRLSHHFLVRPRLSQHFQWRGARLLCARKWVNRYRNFVRSLYVRGSG
jgi:hypothetical protein